MSGLIRIYITCVTRTDKALLNGPTSYGRNISHIFFEPNVLCSYRRRSIMQCSIRNQCSGLFTCIMDYFYVLCMILMLLSCVLCMTLMVFIYVYYGLFACTILVDVMSLFSRFFRSIYRISAKFGRFSVKPARNSPRRFLEKLADLSVKPADLSVKPGVFRCFRFSLFLRHLRCISADFC
jgi:hypothetical protein